LELVVDAVTTKYTERDKSMYQKIAWYLKKSMEHVPGNTGVFFPSYRVQKKVYEQLQDRVNHDVFLERPGMSKEEKQKLFDNFAAAKEEGNGVLLGVVGGSFGEGVDYPGDVMNAACVVGVPLHPPDLETEALIDFYEEKFGDGWGYAYNMPAVNRALQAAGRCIRSADDRGVVMFLDERYTWNTYAQALPHNQYHVTQAPWQEIQHFFDTA
jgi:DNA excision repair protein ERCC-2